MALGTSAFNKIEASSGTSTSATLSRTPTAGNTIVVSATAFWATGASPASLLAVSDATNGSYTAIAAGGVVTNNSGVTGTDDTVNQFYHLSVAATAASMTITGGSGTSGVVGLPVELTGFTGTVSVDKNATPTAVGSSASVTSASTTNVNASAVYIASVGTTAGAGATLTPTSSFTSINSEANGASFPVMDSTQLVVSSTAARTATETINNTHWAVVIAAYSDNGAAALPPGLGPSLHMDPYMTQPMGW